jgi:hypothetical protein
MIPVKDKILNPGGKLLEGCAKVKANLFRQASQAPLEKSRA